MNPYFNHQERKVTASFYLVLGSAMGLLAGQVYLAGYYEAILLPALLTPVFIASGLIRWQGESHFRYDPAAIFSLMALAAFLLLQPETPIGFKLWQFLGLFFPLIAFYLLANAASLVLCLLLLAGLLLLRATDYSLGFQLAFSVKYLLIACLSWFYSLNTQERTRKLEKLTGLDPLTGLYNAEHLQQRLTAEVARSKATMRPLAVLLIELHQYPQLLEELGPAAAKRFIKEAGKITLSNCRSGDEAYRLDDLTLLLLLPNTSINGALVLRERLYQHLFHQLACELGPLDTSITPLVLQPGERSDDLWQRINDSCFHTLPDRVKDSD